MMHPHVCSFYVALVLLPLYSFSGKWCQGSTVVIARINKALNLVVHFNLKFNILMLIISDLDIIFAQTDLLKHAATSSSRTGLYAKQQQATLLLQQHFSTTLTCMLSLWMCLISAISPRSWIDVCDTCRTILHTVCTVMSVDPSLRKINFFSLSFSVPICCCKYELLPQSVDFLYFAVSSLKICFE